MCIFDLIFCISTGEPGRDARPGLQGLPGLVGVKGNRGEKGGCFDHFNVFITTETQFQIYFVLKI